MRWDVVVIGAGAAGMMCAGVAGQRGRKDLVLEAATAPLRPRPAEAIDQPPCKKEAPKPTHGPLPVKSAQRSLAVVTGKGVVTPKTGGPVTKGAPAGRKLHRPAAHGGERRTRSRC